LNFVLDQVTKSKDPDQLFVIRIFNIVQMFLHSLTVAAKFCCHPEASGSKLISLKIQERLIKGSKLRNALSGNKICALLKPVQFY
jgi:hypothetical protein